MIDRRAFIATMSAAAVSGVGLNATKIDRLGMQLYTVRADMEKDFEGTLAKVAAIGYKEVEFAGYFKRTPEQVRDALKKAGSGRASGARRLSEPRARQAASGAGIGADDWPPVPGEPLD